jgi:hypothetical protein
MQHLAHRVVDIVEAQEVDGLSDMQRQRVETEPIDDQPSKAMQASSLISPGSPSRSSKAKT